MTEVREAMIVAGGPGTRLRPLTATVPKPLLPFCGEPFLAGVLARLADAGIRRVWLVVGADPQPFRILQPVAAELDLTLEVVPEPTPLDTAGGVRSVIERCDGATLVLNGDVLTDVDLAAVGRRHLDAGAAATLVLTRVEDTSTFGVCLLEGTRITGFVEKPAPGTLPEHDTVNAGTYVLEPDVLARFPRGPLSFERTVFPTLVAEGQHVEGVVSEAAWADLGTPDRYLEGHRLALHGALTWPSLTRFSPDAEGIRRAASAVVADGAVLEGPVLIAEDVHVAAGAHLGPDTVLAPGCIIGSDAVVVGSVLGPRTRVAARARVRGLVSGADVVVGADVAVTGPVTLGDRTEIPAGGTLGPGSRVPAE
ncbi:MAG: NDP-sugar synthase [Nitriliruptoraceae bacterium]